MFQCSKLCLVILLAWRMQRPPRSLSCAELSNPPPPPLTDFASTWMVI